MKMNHWKALLTALACVGLAGAAEEKLPPNMKLVRMAATPAAIALKNPFEYSQIIVTGQLSTGERIDVTRMAELAGSAGCVQVSPHGLVRPVADGDGELRFALAGQTVALAVKVTGQKE